MFPSSDYLLFISFSNFPGDWAAFASIVIDQAPVSTFITLDFDGLFVLSYTPSPPHPFCVFRMFTPANDYIIIFQKY